MTKSGPKEVQYRSKMVGNGQKLSKTIQKGSKKGQKVVKKCFIDGSKDSKNGPKVVEIKLKKVLCRTCWDTQYIFSGR